MYSVCFFPCCYPFHTLFDSHGVSIPGCRLARSIACSAGRATTTESWRGIPSASWRLGRSETVLSARCEWMGFRNIPHISTEISTGHIGHIYRRPWNAWLLLPNFWVSCEHFLWEGSMRFDATITVDLFGRSDSLLSQKLVYSHRFHMMPWSWHFLQATGESDAFLLLGFNQSWRKTMDFWWFLFPDILG